MVTAQLLKKYFNNKKIFITGHTGFKGTWLTAVLSNTGAKLKGYSLTPDSENYLFSLLKPFNFIENIFDDIRHKKKLADEIIAFEPDYVFHLAAQSLVRRSYEIPSETFDVNVTGTANLLESLTDLKNKCTCIIVTTDKVYKNEEKNRFFTEDDVLGGNDPYSASKACAEIATASFRNSFFSTQTYPQHLKAIATARAGNVIGGGDWSRDRLLPDIVKSLSNDKIIEIRNPASVRPWQHVLEPLSGYLLLAGILDETSGNASNAFNFGPFKNDHLTVKEMVELSIEKWGHGSWKDVSNSNQPHEAGLLGLDISKAVSELKWAPKLSAKDAIEWTIDWYKQPEERLVDFTFKQINRYWEL